MATITMTAITMMTRIGMSTLEIAPDAPDNIPDKGLESTFS